MPAPPFFPQFSEPELDESDDETGYSWDCDLTYPLENEHEDEEG